MQQDPKLRGKIDVLQIVLEGAKSLTTTSGKNHRLEVKYHSSSNIKNK
jgi:hypothetical protein